MALLFEVFTVWRKTERIKIFSARIKRSLNLKSSDHRFLCLYLRNQNNEFRNHEFRNQQILNKDSCPFQKWSSTNIQYFKRHYQLKLGKFCQVFKLYLTECLWVKKVPTTKLWMWHRFVKIFIKLKIVLWKSILKWFRFCCTNRIALT